MALKSSKNGNVKWAGSDVPHSRGWNLNDLDDVQVFSDSDTAGQKSRVSGVQDSTFSFNVYQDTADDLEGRFRKGDTGTAELYEDGTRYWSIPAIVISVETICDIEAGTIEGITVNCGQTAAPTPPA